MEFNPTWEKFKISDILPEWKPTEINKIQISWSNAANLAKKLIKAKLPEIHIPEFQQPQLESNLQQNNAEEIDLQSKSN